MVRKLLGPFDSGERNKFLHVVPVRSPRIFILDVSKPLRLRRHVGQLSKIGRG